MRFMWNVFIYFWYTPKRHTKRTIYRKLQVLLLKLFEIFAYSDELQGKTIKILGLKSVLLPLSFLWLCCSNSLKKLFCLVYAESYAKPYAKSHTRMVYAKPYADGIREGSQFFESADGIRKAIRRTHTRMQFIYRNSWPVDGIREEVYENLFRLFFWWKSLYYYYYRFI